MFTDMNKILLLNPEKCAGCRTCEAACSFQHEKEFNPAKSRIRIVRWEHAGLDVPSLCQQCDYAPCETVCPVKAILRDKETEAIVIDYDLCIGCKICMMTCPFGAISIDPDNRKLIKCDLCGGKPACAEFCPTGTITYTTATNSNLRKRRLALQKMEQLLNKTSMP